MQTERKKRSGFMLAYPFEEKRLNKWTFPVLVQPKLDGIRCGVTQSEDGSVVLKSSTQEDIISVPHVNNFIEEFCKHNNLTIPELDGELYIHGWSFEDIFSITGRTVNPHKSFTKIELHVFDLRLGALPQWIRLGELHDFMKMVPKSSPLQLITTKPADSFDEVWNLYQQFISEGYEGIIVRELNNLYLPRRSTQIMKFKPKKDDYYTIIGMNEEIDKKGRPKGRLGSFTCVGSAGDIFTVGSKLTNEQRIKYWGQDLIGWLVHVQYQSTFSRTGIPRFAVFMELINPKQVLGGVVEMDPNSD